MADSTTIDILADFGLTRQEAVIYSEFISHGEMTGYEVGKETGISRSNVYSSISSLVEKGALYVVQGESSKYTPVEINQFTKNRIEELTRKALYLKKHCPKKIKAADGYITIQGEKNIRNKIREMLEKTEFRLYIMASADIVREFEEDLKKLIETGKKVVILTDDFKLKGAKIYETKPENGQLRFITDSAYVLTGELTGGEHDSCLYSGQQNLVAVMKEALKNKIILLDK